MAPNVLLLDLVEKNKLETILDAFTQATDVAAIISRVDGTPITEPFNFSSLCRKYCRATENGRRFCHESDSYGGRESARTRKNVVYHCLNSGLLDCAAPIIIEGEHVANVLCGQVLDAPVDPDTALKNARKIGILDIDGYLAELDQIPIISLDRFKAVVRLMEVVTQTISEMAFHKYLLTKRSRRFLEKLINSVSECILSTRKDGTVCMVNDACSSVFGCPKENLLGQPLASLFSNEASAIYYEHLKETTAKGNSRALVRIENMEKQPIFMQMSLSRICTEDPETSGYVAVMRDITEEKRAEKMKEDLLGMLTHDLGNPILSIQKALELLSDEQLGSLNDAQKEITGLTYQTGNQLYGMVTDFLDTYRHENGEFFLRRMQFDMVQLVRDSLRQIELFARDKSLAMAFHPQQDKVLVKADANRLKRVCINLLENAIKYSHQKGIITVALSASKGKDLLSVAETIPEDYGSQLDPGKTFVYLSVSDEGIGISEKDQLQVFEKFFVARLKNGKGRRGLGLGLTFCKLATEAHGGCIWVTSPLYDDKGFKRRGCRFSLILPAGVQAAG
jgi:PAS domain S-box-containing protein